MRWLLSQRTRLNLAVLLVVGALAVAAGRAWVPLSANGSAVAVADAAARADGAAATDAGPRRAEHDAARDAPGGLAGELERAAVALLAVRSHALASHDEAAWASTIADPTTADGRRQMVAYTGLVALGVTDLTATDVHAMPGGYGDGAAASHTVTVELGHRIPGYDSEPRVAARTVTLAWTQRGWRIACDGSSIDQLQVWDLPDLHVRRSATTLVAGNVPETMLAERLADADASAQRLSSLFGTSTPSVLVVPATDAEAARQLGRAESQTPSQVAATTDGRVGPRGTAGADRVVLAPEAFRRLTPEGRRVVIAHELTHVASRATTGTQLPLWLSEGFAEYVAWSPVSMPVQAAAAQLLARVRSQRLPASLPGPSEFDTARGDLATAYQASWLVVRAIAAAHGEAALVQLYRAVAGGPGAAGLSVDDALRTVLGTDTAAVVAAWRAELERLAQ